MAVADLVLDFDFDVPGFDLTARLVDELDQAKGQGIIKREAGADRLQHRINSGRATAHDRQSECVQLVTHSDQEADEALEEPLVGSVLDVLSFLSAALHDFDAGREEYLEGGFIDIHEGSEVGL